MAVPIITGWPSIAKFLGVSIRTAKDYHWIHSMPVRKITGKTVHIITDEVLIWMVKYDELKRARRREKG